jgi:TolB-like protein/class 3 adenylate cyclase/Tfp pilus assembly protein PilF
MFVDIVGFTTMGQRSESLALGVVDESRGLLRPVFLRHSGREVKTMGDGFLVEFANSLDAVRCAYDIQRASREFNFSLPEDKRFRLRVGVHLGDVVESGGDIFGDAVNVASRVEPLAAEGGICISRQVYDQVRNKFELPLISLGERVLKNVSAPVEVFRVGLPWEEVRAQASTEAEPNGLDRRRVAVLPMKNMSPDPNDEYFADGMTEELITTLSKVGNLTVLARTSISQYKDTTKRVSTIANELQAGTLIEGSVRKAGNKVRITVQLLDGKSEGHFWAENYDRNLDDVFEIQSNVAKNVSEALAVRLAPTEKKLIDRKATSSSEAHTLYLKGRFYWNQRARDNAEKALEYFKKAVELDPEFALAYSGISDCYNILADYGWMKKAEALPLARQFALKALSLDNDLAEAHASLGLSHDEDWNFTAMESELKRALELRPNYAIAYHWYTLMLSKLGRNQEAYEMELKGLESDPYSPILQTGVALTLYFLRRYAEANERLDILAETHPEYASIPLWRSTLCSVRGDHEKAISEAKRGLALNPVPGAELNLALVYLVAGRHDDAKFHIDRVRSMQEREAIPWALLGQTEFLAGMKEDAFKHIEEGVRTRDKFALWVRFDPLSKDLLQDPRWKAVELEIENTLSNASRRE